MIFTIPKEEADRLDDIKIELNNTILKMSLKYGVPHGLIEDSKVIEESVLSIAHRINGWRKQLETAGTYTNFLGYDGQPFVPIKKVFLNKYIGKMLKNNEELDKLIKEDERKNECLQFCKECNLKLCPKDDFNETKKDNKAGRKMRGLRKSAEKIQ
jgi:hypothetical protein